MSIFVMLPLLLPATFPLLQLALLPLSFLMHLLLLLLLVTLPLTLVIFVQPVTDGVVIVRDEVVSVRNRKQGPEAVVE